MKEVSAIRNPKLQKIIQSIESLPTIPEAALKISRLADNENTTVQEIVSVINEDPAIASQLLKVANSPFYGFLGEVSNIDHAVALLGFREIKSVALASAILSNHFSGSRVVDKQLKQLWKHSTLTGFVARLLGDQLGDPDIASLFLAGLIHDLGSIIIIRYMQEEYKILLAQIDSNGGDVSALEKKILGASHSEIGALALKKWKFPPKLISSTLYHHQPWRDQGFTSLSTMIHYADALVRMLGVVPYAGERALHIRGFLNSRGAILVNKLGFDISVEIIERLMLRISTHSESTDGGAGMLG